jgi:hypothetical protein
MTEVWFRNPHNYIRELAEVGHPNIVWDRGMLIKRRIDPWKHAQLYYAARKDWRILLVGDQGSALYDEPNGPKTPIAVFPTWDASAESLELLEEMMQFPIGDDADACNDPNVEIDERPVAGQPHYVVVHNLPAQRSGPARALVRKLKEMQEDYPECVLMLHGLYSWQTCFGMGFGAADVDPRTNAGKGKVTLPSGKEMIAEKTVATPQWVTMLGMKPVDLTREPRNRCIYNIKSAIWAAENFRDNIAFKTVGTAPVNPSAPVHVAATAPSPWSSQGGHAGKPGDKIRCDTCSLQNQCKYFRSGSVCSVPGSEPAKLANHFGTRDADQIIDGLGVLMQLGTRRLERGLGDEELYGELDPEVTKIINQLFNQGKDLAKLLDPTLRGGPQVQVNVGQQGAVNAALQAATPNQVVGSIVRELESRGIPRDKITPAMVGNLLAEMTGGSAAPKAIEAEVISSTVE